MMKRFFSKDISILLILSMMSTFLLQTMLANPFAMRIPILIYNIFIHFVFLIFFRCLTGSLKWSIRIFSLIIWLFGTVNFLVVEFRSTPLMPWDIYSWQTAANVLDNYSIPFAWRYILPSLAFLMIFICSFFPYWKKRKTAENKVVQEQQTNHEKISNKQEKISSHKTKTYCPRKIKAYLGFLFIGIILFMGSIFFTRSDLVMRNLSLNTTLFNSKGMARDNGYLVNFIYCTRYLSVEKPQGYSTKRVASILEKIEPDDNRIKPDLTKNQSLNIFPETNRNAFEKLNQNCHPDIIVVMNESFCDLQFLQPFETNIDYMPFIRNFQGNAKKGTTYPSVVGGSTASSEFEFLTGMSMGFLPSGSIAYMQFLHQPLTSMVSLLEDNGYATLAMHPYYKSGWNRPKVYDYFGFDKVKFNEDFEHQQKIRKYISDKALYDEILMELDNRENPDQPQFIFTVSMQNHGGYTDIYDNFSPDVKITSGKSSTALNQYLSLIKRSDQDLKDLIQTLQKRERPTLLLFFGDHQPNDYTVKPLKENLNLSDEQWQENRRKANYFLWANYPLSDLEEEAYSNNYLGCLLLREAHLPYDKWYTFIDRTRKQYPIINDAFYYNQYGEKANISAQSFPPEINDYAILAYDYLFGETFAKYR